jgi:hypothetical protein
MECFCKEKSYDLRLETDFSADPIWCDRCGCNLDLDDIPISDELRDILRAWASNYEKLARDEIKREDIRKFEQQHNYYGIQLVKKVQQELGDEYTITYRYS